MKRPSLPGALPLLITLAIAGTAALGQTKVTQHMMLYEPTGTDLNVAETLIIEGSGKVQIVLPADAEIKGTRGGEVKKSGKPGIWDVTVKAEGPETRVDVNWTMPFITPEDISGRILHGGGPVRMVFPKGVKVTGAALESNGTEPTTMASIFTLKGATYKISLDGAGTLRAERPAAAAEPEAEGPTIQQILPRFYDRLNWVLGLTFAILAAGFILNYRAQPKG
ncbi:MAG: hypothetical protein NTZ56_07390 [Acidobacteria bacterium]|nr:hypothetical protein [Acidobacteriota bacterium]